MHGPREGEVDRGWIGAGHQQSSRSAARQVEDTIVALDRAACETNWEDFAREEGGWRLCHRLGLEGRRGELCCGRTSAGLASVDAAMASGSDSGSEERAGAQ